MSKSSIRPIGSASARARSVRRAILPVSAAVGALLLAGCTAGGTAAGEDTFGEVISSAPASGNGDEWVTWDHDTCSFVPAKEHPKEWTPETRKVNGTFTVGFASQDTTNEVNLSMNDSITQAASAAGVDLAVADYKFPSTSEPVSAARSITVREPAVVISNNQLDDLLDSVNQIYKDACAPVVQVVTKAQGTVLFGPSNADMGELQGQRLVDVAKASKWTEDEITLFTTFYSPAGPEVALRASECAKTVKETFPNVKVVEHDTKSTTSLELQNAFTDQLTANPDADKILVCTVADLWATADANALELAGKAADSAVTGVNGGSSVLDAIKKGNSALVGSVDLGAAEWGSYWVPLAEDIASGKPVPSEVYAPVKMLPEEVPAR